MRAKVFTHHVMSEKLLYKGIKQMVIIRRGNEFNDGYEVFKKITNIKGTIMIKYIN